MFQHLLKKQWREISCAAEKSLEQTKLPEFFDGWEDAENLGCDDAENFEYDEGE